MKILRIAFTIVSAIFIAAVIPVGALYSWTAAIVCGIGAFLFFGLMLLCKQRQEENERLPRHNDFAGTSPETEKKDNDGENGAGR